MINLLKSLFKPIVEKMTSILLIGDRSNLIWILRIHYDLNVKMRLG